MTDDTVELLRSLAIDRTASRGHEPAHDGKAQIGFRGNAPDPHKRVPRSIALLLVTVLCAIGALAGLGLYAWTSHSHQDRITDSPELPTPVARAGNTEPRFTASGSDSPVLTASGYIVARRKAAVAAEITGKVAEVLVEEGMTVTAGQVVARLDNILAEKDYELAKSRAGAAEAAVGVSAADLDDATRIMMRTQFLSQRAFASEADLTKAQARVGVLQAQQRQAQSQLQTATIDVQRSASVLDKHQIRAPFSGVVTERSAQPGEMISPLSVGGFTRTGICTIVDMDSLEIEVDVNESFISRIKPGGAVDAILDAYPGWTIPASLIGIVPAANREKATVKVRLRLKVKDPRILPDMAVKVTFRSDDSGTGVDQ
ncbi:efflux RND transporter periplasmic adaptor subunit [Bradyrhizobium sp. Leaf401]|uniref:efflux RND transporter periplasmic adaptor subunit n=1 Tax=Bradyrhizobium sp. Leaf401 TaxID=2876564 RepID=UPI001E5EB7D0|nr:efflux RND transporter periplasmic adaptor subunit [Bradyrhizobium sp. Leaf401]